VKEPRDDPFVYPSKIDAITTWNTTMERADFQQYRIAVDLKYKGYVFGNVYNKVSAWRNAIGRVGPDAVRTCLFDPYNLNTSEDRAAEAEYLLGETYDPKKTKDTIMRPWLYLEWDDTAKGNHKGTFRNPAIIRVFAAHLNVVSQADTSLYGNWYEAISQPKNWQKNALLLSCLSVFRALLLWTKGDVPDKTADSFSYKEWGLDSSYARWIARACKLVDKLEQKHWDKIIEEAEAVRARVYPRRAHHVQNVINAPIEEADSSDDEAIID